MDLLDRLSEEMWRARSEHVRKYYYEPEMLVKFSAQGYCQARASKKALFLFSNPNLSVIPTVIGYPFSIDPHQERDFLISVWEPVRKGFPWIPTGPARPPTVSKP